MREVLSIATSVESSLFMQKNMTEGGKHIGSCFQSSGTMSYHTRYAHPAQNLGQESEEDVTEFSHRAAMMVRRKNLQSLKKSLR